MNQSNPLIARSANPWPLISDCTHSFDGADETVKQYMNEVHGSSV